MKIVRLALGMVAVLAAAVALAMSPATVGVAAAQISNGPNPSPAFISAARDCLYNRKGLEGYFSSLWMTGFKADGTTGCGGVDIVAMGDSYTQGYGLLGDLQSIGLQDRGALQAWPNLLRQYLQKAINPPNVPGGYGYWQFDRTGDSQSSGTARTPSQAVFGSAGLTQYTNDAAGWGCQFCEWEATTGQRYLLCDFNPNYFPCTSLQIAGANTTTAKIDVYATPAGTTPITIGTGTYVAQSQALAGSAFWGTRTALMTVNGGVTPSVKYRVQIANASTSTDLFASGLVFYNKDEASGIRMFNFGGGGYSCTSFNAANAASGDAAMGTSAADGSSVIVSANARLVIYMIGANDYGTTKAAFKTQITTFVQACHAWTTAPSILLVQQCPQYGVSVGVNDWATMPLMRQRDALKEICDDATMGVYCSLYDTWKMHNYVSPQRLNVLGLINGTDHIHPTLPEQKLIAQGMAVNLVPRTQDLRF